MGTAVLYLRCCRVAIASTLMLVAGASWSACTTSTDPRFTEFDRLMRTQPAAAARAIESQLRTPDATQVTFRAELYAALADAYASQEKHEETQQAVTAGLALVHDQHSTIYLNLVYLDALSPKTETEIRSGRKRAEALMKLQPNGSEAQGCVLLTLGLLEHFADRPDQASIYLTRAYRASKRPDRERQRIIAATVLSMVLQTLNDYRAALTLSQEVIDSHSRHKADFELATAYFMRGFILTELRDHRAAVDMLRRSRTLSIQMQDTIGVAYADLLICTNDIALGRLRDARSLCEHSLRTFETARIDDPAKQALLVG